MKEFRMGRNTTEHYSSFEEAAKAWNCRPVIKKTKDEKKLVKQQQAFCEKHKCKACGQPMAWVDGHWMTCVNEKCKGIKIEKLDREGNINISYIVSCEEIDDLGAEIAQNIFN